MDISKLSDQELYEIAMNSKMRMQLRYKATKELQKRINEIKGSQA